MEDPYAWLRDPDYPEVRDPEILRYLEEENTYFEDRMSPYRNLVQTLFDEIKNRQPEEDASVPYYEHGYWYQWRYAAGAQYRVWLRVPADDAEQPPPDATSSRWQVFLDEPALAAPHAYFRLGGLSVSPNGRYLAWSDDNNGSERYTLRIRDLQTGQPLGEPIADTLGSPEWTADSQQLMYLAVNEQWRPYQARLHKLGAPPEQSRVLFEETDEAFFVGLDITSSEQYLIISSGDHVTSETRLLPADDPLAEPLLMATRRQGHQYSVDHGDGCFFVLTNRDHKNFSVVRTAEATPTEENWQTLISGSDEHYLTWLLRRQGRLMLGERVKGLDSLKIIDDDGDSHYIAFPETTCTLGPGANEEYASNLFRVHYQSMVTPATVFDYDLSRRALITRKVQSIPTGYDSTLYTTERLTAKARDGVDVPVSIVYRKDRPKAPGSPLYLYGYGAYGNAIMPGFSSSRLSLLDRGFAFAIAHIRGGDDLGYHWYEAGKLDKRENTFNDFVDVARHLTSAGFTGAGHIAISGGSAGGELMGAVVNQAPELWGAVAAHVPFMDVLNTMLDASLPLTPIEWPEWGNPIEDKRAFETILAYSPYDQLRPGAYPPMLVTAGLNDPRVTYWEPAKYVAKLRTLKTDHNWLLLKTNMDAGHGGQSGRFDALLELAEEYAFMLISLGMAAADQAD